MDSALAELLTQLVYIQPAGTTDVDGDITFADLLGPFPARVSTATGRRVSTRDIDVSTSGLAYLDGSALATPPAAGSRLVLPGGESRPIVESQAFVAEDGTVDHWRLRYGA